MLLEEDDKENKIKNNCNNIINYLKSEELWNREVYCHKDFNKNINELKSANIQIKQIVFLYEFLEEDEEIEDRLDKLLALIKNSEKEKSKRKGEEVKVLGEGIGGKEKKIKVKEPKKRIKKMFFKSDETQRTPFEAIKSSNKFGRKTNYSYIRSIMSKRSNTNN